MASISKMGSNLVQKNVARNERASQQCGGERVENKLEKGQLGGTAGRLQIKRAARVQGVRARWLYARLNPVGCTWVSKVAN